MAIIIRPTVVEAERWPVIIVRWRVIVRWWVRVQRRTRHILGRRLAHVEIELLRNAVFRSEPMARSKHLHLRILIRGDGQCADDIEFGTEIVEGSILVAVYGQV